MTEDLIIRPFEPRDQDAARRLILAGLGEHFGYVDENLNPDLDDIIAHYPNAHLVVAEQDGRVVGTGFLRRVDGTTAEVVRMSVAPALRRSGVGRAVLGALLAHARERGYARAVLFTLEHWHDAVAFYRSCGFRERGRIDGDIEFALPLREVAYPKSRHR
ncbi:MAG: GNAT family N-acetyltransferase [Dehalococcoidia bacterium]